MASELDTTQLGCLTHGGLSTPGGFQAVARVEIQGVTAAALQGEPGSRTLDVDLPRRFSTGQV